MRYPIFNPPRKLVRRCFSFNMQAEIVTKRSQSRFYDAQVRTYDGGLKVHKISES